MQKHVCILSLALHKQVNVNWNTTDLNLARSSFIMEDIFSKHPDLKVIKLKSSCLKLWVYIFYCYC